MRYRHKHRPLPNQSLYLYINGKLILTIKRIKTMANIIIDVEDNQAELDALKAQAADALTAITDGITKAQAVADALQAFQISFTASVAPTT